ncbi:hypothetical protein [Castellaniella caeni]|uniref:hypothetical protein n=1 Tax=Castellaniella caeni TaxID=266123 RepID=UPI0008362AC0|nr:hypothetical protein [Castellaniella caeni]
MDVSFTTKMSLLAGGLLLTLSACSDPQQAAQKSLQKIAASLQQEKTDLDPQKQLAAYQQMVTDVQAITKDYADSATGKALAAGQSVDGISVAGLTKLRDAMAERAPCYASPTSACLRPFSHHPSGPTQARGGAAASGSAQQAAEQICSQGFAAADKALEGMKINKPAYAKEVIQLGLAAGQCQRPDDVKAAVNAFMAIYPGADEQQVNSLLSILATPGLQAAWPEVMAQLEKGLQSGQYGKNATASVTLNLALGYANAGNSAKALEKYRDFTDTLHYRADPSTQQQLAAAIMASGDIDSGLKIMGATANQDVLAVALNQGINALATRLGLFQPGITTRLPFNENTTLHDYLSAVSADVKPAYQSATQAFEGQIDNMAPTVRRSNQTVGLIGLDRDYALLALIHQKLGEPQLATAALKKGQAYGARMLGQPENSPDYPSIAAPGAVVLIAQGDYAGAAHLIQAGNLSSDAYGALLMKAAGQTMNAEQTLDIANTISRQYGLYNTYTVVIPEMAQAGRMDDIDKLIAAWAGNPAQKRLFYGLILDGLVAHGDADAAKEYAQKQHLADDDLGKLRLDAQLLKIPAIATSQAKAEPLIREMFQIGQTLDKGQGVQYSGGSDRMIAQNAAAAAFRNGYVDLGIELYRAAANKDQRPLLAAFEKKIAPQDTTRVLMLANNQLSGDRMKTVVDHAIRALDS